jgi:hypothetical protein
LFRPVIPGGYVGGQKKRSAASFTPRAYQPGCDGMKWTSSWTRRREIARYVHWFRFTLPLEVRKRSTAGTPRGFAKRIAPL